MFLSYFLAPSLPIGDRSAEKIGDRRKGREKMGGAGMGPQVSSCRAVADYDISGIRQR